MRKEAGGSGNAWHGDIYKMVFAIHDFFPSLSYVTIATDGNPQTLVWRESRAGFVPRFNSLEVISRLTWFDLRENLDILNRQTEKEAQGRVAASLGGRPANAP